MSVRVLDLQNLSHEEALICAQIVPKEFHHYLKGSPPLLLPEAHVLGVGVFNNHTLEGIALAHFVPGVRQASIDFFYFSLEHAAHLLEKITHLLKEQGNSVLTLKVNGDSEKTRSLISLAKQKGWSGPRPYLSRYYFDVQNFHPPWFERTYSFSKNVTPFLWKERTLKEEKDVLQWADQSQIPPSVSPFFWPEPLENLNSLGLRYRDTLIGWIVTHRMDPETIRYTALYCDPNHRAKGDIIKLLIQSIKLQQHSSIPRSLFEINHQLVEPKWIDFVQQRLAPHAQDVLHKQILWTHLN